MSQETMPNKPLTGRTVLVTGANSGLGLYCARHFGGLGARVIVACRNQEKANEAFAGSDHAVEVEGLDLGDLESVRACVGRIRQRHGHLDILLNNAGVMMPPYTLTPQGFELQFGTNHLGHFAFTMGLFPLLQAAPQGRVVTVSSIAHHRGKLEGFAPPSPGGYDRNLAYADSKLANLIFAFELARRLQASQSTVKSLAAHPGVTQTELFRHLGVFEWIAGMVTSKVAEGAAPLIQACLRDDLPGGSYFGPTGFREMRGAPGSARVSARAQDPQLAERLWAYSEEVTQTRLVLS